jgi:AraC-like DNA-binding protein
MNKMLPRHRVDAVGMKHSGETLEGIGRIAIGMRLEVSGHRASPGEVLGHYHLRLRMQNAARLLDSSVRSVQEVAEACGYSDSYYFSRLFKQIMGLSPRNYRRASKDDLGAEAARRGLQVAPEQLELRRTRQLVVWAGVTGVPPAWSFGKRANRSPAKAGRR